MSIGLVYEPLFLEHETGAHPENAGRLRAVEALLREHGVWAALPHLVAAAARPPRNVADLVNISSTGGRVARAGTAVYSLTKFGVGALSESLRQELIPNRVRVSVVEPGTVATELASHTREELREGIVQMTQSIELLRPDDIAEAITYVVTRDRRVAVNEILIRTGEQTW